MHVALRCGCSVPVAEWWDTSPAGIAQLVAHEAGESILCREGSDALFPDDFGEDLLLLLFDLLSESESGFAVKLNCFFGLKALTPDVLLFSGDKYAAPLNEVSIQCSFSIYSFTKSIN